MAYGGAKTPRPNPSGMGPKMPRPGPGLAAPTHGITKTPRATPASITPKTGRPTPFGSAGRASGNGKAPGAVQGSTGAPKAPQGRIPGSRTSGATKGRNPVLPQAQSKGGAKRARPGGMLRSASSAMPKRPRR